MSDSRWVQNNTYSGSYGDCGVTKGFDEILDSLGEIRISDFNTTAISSVSEGTRTAVEAERYTLDGRRITTPQKGINIVKYSDGRVSKEVVTDQYPLNIIFVYV